MKAIAIDSASPCLSISAINGELYSSIILNIGMHQSEKILVAIEQVLKDRLLYRIYFEKLMPWID